MWISWMIVMSLFEVHHLHWMLSLHRLRVSLLQAFSEPQHSKSMFKILMQLTMAGL